MTSIIDDQDLSKVVYNGTWVKGGSVNEYDNTVASSTTIGDSFTVTFKGTSITVYGTLDATSGGVVTSYSINGGSPSNATAQSGPGDTYRQQFWTSPQLSLASHQLHVTMVKVNYDPQPGEGTVWFDYFLVADPTITSTASLTPSSTSPPIINAQHSSSVNIGAIVGGVIGGLALLLAAVFIFVFYRRRAKVSREKPDNALHHASGDNLHASVHPFLLGNREISDTSSTSRTVQVEFDPNSMVFHKPIATGHASATIPTQNMGGSPHHHSGVPLPATAVPQKYAPGREHPQIDHRTLESASEADAPRFPLRETVNPGQIQEVGTSRQPSDAQTPGPETFAELPPVYSPV